MNNKIFIIILSIISILYGLQIDLDKYQNQYVKYINDHTFEYYFNFTQNLKKGSHRCNLLKFKNVAFESRFNYPKIPYIRKAIILYNNEDKVIISNIKNKILYNISVCLNTIQEIDNVRCGKNSNKWKESYIHISKRLYRIHKQYFPEKIIELTNTSHLRKVKTGILEISPFRYHHQNRTLEVITSMKIKILNSNRDCKKDLKNNLPKASFALNGEFYQIFKNLFINFNHTKFIKSNEKKLLIISADDFFQFGEIYRKYKTGLGFATINVPISNITKTKNSSEIKDYIINLYNTWDLTNIILIGDIERIPSVLRESFWYVSDTFYVLFNKNDFFVNVFISRISGQNNFEIMKQIKKFMEYDKININEKLIVQGIASDEFAPGSLTDCEYMEQLNKLIKLKKPNTIYKECDPNANKKNIFDNINKGVSLINYIGHGSGTSWITSKFNTTDAFNLYNKFHNAFIIDVSCFNGNIQINPCLAESLMRGNEFGSGSIAVYVSSPSASWLPPVTMQYFITSLFIRNEINSIGGSSFTGAMLTCVIWKGYSCRQLIEGYILFGDNTQLIKLH